jgi:3',5'-cyclic AMP phosphodiesterase CpdA
MLIAHITDPHIGLDPASLAGRVIPEQALRQALAHVGALDPMPEVLLLTGDLSDAGREQDYATLLSLLRQELPGFEQGRPRVLAIPGNHDLPQQARQVLSDVMPRAAGAPAEHACIHVEHGGMHFIGLDTSVPHMPHGELGSAQLAWLERTLNACAGQPVMIFMHHPPLVAGMAAMDECGLRQGMAELGRLVAAHGAVKLIAAGHYHRPIVGALGGAPVVVAPSSSHQLELDLHPGAPLVCRLEPAMFGLYRWTPEQGLACHFSYVQPFEPRLPITE